MSEQFALNILDDNGPSDGHCQADPPPEYPESPPPPNYTSAVSRSENSVKYRSNCDDAAPVTNIEISDEIMTFTPEDFLLILPSRRNYFRRTNEEVGEEWANWRTLVLLVTKLFFSRPFKMELVSQPRFIKIDRLESYW